MEIILSFEKHERDNFLKLLIFLLKKLKMLIKHTEQTGKSEFQMLTSTLSKTESKNFKCLFTCIVFKYYLL